MIKRLCYSEKWIPKGIIQAIMQTIAIEIEAVVMHDILIPGTGSLLIIVFISWNCFVGQIVGSKWLRKLL